VEVQGPAGLVTEDLLFFFAEAEACLEGSCLTLPPGETI